MFSIWHWKTAGTLQELSLWISTVVVAKFTTYINGFCFKNSHYKVIWVHRNSIAAVLMGLWDYMHVSLWIQVASGSNSPALVIMYCIVILWYAKQLLEFDYIKLNKAISFIFSPDLVYNYTCRVPLLSSITFTTWRSGLLMTEGDEVSTSTIIISRSTICCFPTHIFPVMCPYTCSLYSRTTDCKWQYTSQSSGGINIYSNPAYNRWWPKLCNLLHRMLLISSIMV